MNVEVGSRGQFNFLQWNLPGRTRENYAIVAREVTLLIETGDRHVCCTSAQMLFAATCSSSCHTVLSLIPSHSGNVAADSDFWDNYVNCIR